ncbi:Intraflagellar transport protein 46 [Nymphon striatum]|nr:Intraflagellar transport protein 46 [Nymphon striatum]
MVQDFGRLQRRTSSGGNSFQENSTGSVEVPHQIVDDMTQQTLENNNSGDEVDQLMEHKQPMRNQLSSIPQRMPSASRQFAPTADNLTASSATQRLHSASNNQPQSASLQKQLFKDTDAEEEEEEEEEGEEEDEEHIEEDEDEDDEKEITIEGCYDAKDYEHLPVSQEIKDLFQYITKYTSQTIYLEHKLSPFIPDYIPAVGDIDAMIKVPCPDEELQPTLGLHMLDEPYLKQTDPTVLNLQLRAVSKQNNPTAATVKKLNIAQNKPRQIDAWIQSIGDLHRTKPPASLHYTKNMPDIDGLMQEWPSEFEELLKEADIPSAELDCDLSEYVDILCAFLDIPVYKSKVQSLHMFLSLYSQFKNSQHFKNLALDNQLDNSLKTSQYNDY